MSKEATDEVMETTSAEEMYESNDHKSYDNEISYEKECVVEISTSMALGNIQDSVKHAFRNLFDEMVPLYVASGVEQMDAWYRVRAKTESSKM